MPAKDRLHDAVKRALIKDGWSIAKEQYFLNFPGRRLWIDLEASKASDNQAILIEVKGFDAPSPVEYLASAIGKYVLYRTALKRMRINLPLYLAVPLTVYDTIFTETMGHMMAEEFAISLLVFDAIKEEIVKWIL